MIHASGTGANGAVSSAVDQLSSEPPSKGEECGRGSAPALRAAPLGRGSGAISARIQERRPWNGLGQSSHIAKHDLDNVSDGVGGILGSTGTSQPSIDEELKEIEREHPEQQEGH